MALFGRDFSLLLAGKANESLIRCLTQANGICGMELFAMDAAVVSFADKLGDKRVISCPDNDAAA